MKKIIALLRNPVTKDYSDNTGYVFKKSISWLVAITFLIFHVLIIFLKCNSISGSITFLSVACASTVGGAAIGFLFGLPRAEKYRFINTSAVDHNAKDYSYADNTNLEEVSDWITKIIVGLTLVKFNTIIRWINQSAYSIQNVFTEGCDSTHLNFYVFGYTIIIFYFLVGCGICYLWARTNLSLIFTKFKKEQEKLNAKQTALISQIQAINNPDLNLSTVALQLNNTKGIVSPPVNEFPTANFKSKVETIYNTKTVIDKSDLQKGRWGGLSTRKEIVLEASYVKEESFFGLYKVNLKIRSLNIDKPLTSEVVFFLHDTFPSEIVYSHADNNLATISVVAYEAFVVGALLEDGTELELDLNKVKGFPDGFYWEQ
jgi:hypothetical protein